MAAKKINHQLSSLKPSVNHLIYSTSGMSLVGVIIATAIIAIVGLSFATLLTNAQLGQNGVKFRSDADNFNEEVRSLLSSSAACTNSFGGLTAGAASSHNVSSLKDGSASPGASVYSQGGAYGDNSIKLNSMTLSNYVAGSAAGTAQMTLLSNLATAKQALGTQAVSRTINISLTLDASNAIVSCMALAKMSDGIWQRSSGNLNNIFFVAPPAPVAGGKVGIGTASPTDTLHIVKNGVGAQANVKFQSDNQSQLVLSSPNNFLYFNDPTAAVNQKWSRWSSRGGATQLDIMDDAVGLTPLRSPITFQHSTGNVGIGTTNPQGHLHLHQNVNSVGLLMSGNQAGWATGIILNNETPATGKSFGLYSASDGTFRFTDVDVPVDRLVVGPTGNVGIGTTTPLSKLHVHDPTGVASVAFFKSTSASAGGIMLGDNSTVNAPTIYSNGDHLTFWTNAVQRVVMRSDGNVGIGTTGPSYKLDVVGDVNASGCVRASGSTLGGTCASDERLKADVRPFDLGLEALLGINPQFFTYNGLGGYPASDKPELGVIAQDVEKTAPQLIVTKEVKLNPEDDQTTEIKQVNYTAFTYVLINAVKDLYHRWFDDSQALHREIASVKASDQAKDQKIQQFELENAAKTKELIEVRARLDKIEKVLNLNNAAF